MAKDIVNLLNPTTEIALIRVCLVVLSSPRLFPGPHDPLYTQMRIWLLTAELHLNENNVWEAEQCVGEARMISPLSYHLMHAKGRLHESKGDFDLARQCYESSLGINPSHVASLHHLGQVSKRSTAITNG